MTFRSNRVHHNDGEGIFFEISDGVLVEGNVVWENGWKNPRWGYGAGILISSSRNAMVRDNVVVNNGRSISVISQNRSGYPKTASGDSSNQRVEDNVVVSRNGVGLSGFYQDWAGTMYTAPNVGGSGNRYWSSVNEPTDGRFEWQGGWRRTLAEYNATPGEEGGRYLTTAEKDAILAAAGVP